MIDIEIIIALGIIIMPIYVYRFIYFFIEIYRYNKRPKPPTFEEVLKKYIKDYDNIRKGN